MINEKLEFKFRTNMTNAAMLDFLHDANGLDWYHLNSIAKAGEQLLTGSIREGWKYIKISGK